MKKYLKVFNIVLLTLVVASASILPHSAMDQMLESEVLYTDEKIYCNATIDDDFADNCVVVILDKNFGDINMLHTTDDFEATGILDVEDLTTIAYGTPEAIEENSMISQLDEENFRQILKLTLSAPSKENVLSVIHQLEQMDGIVYAGPDYITDTCEAIPTDTKFDQQWGLDKIQVTEAWDITRGDEGVRVGVIDTGIAAHSDFGDNLATGWDFYNENEITTDDTNGHGTHVAGIIGAQGDNEFGVSGVAWDVTLVPLQVTYNGTNAYFTDIIEAISYATNNNIPILNYSRGFNTYNAGMNQAIANYPGLFVCTAGNHGADNGIDGRDIDPEPYYAASYTSPNIISVLNTKSDDTIKNTSNYGPNTVHLAAPGTNIYSTYPSNDYKYLDGTSMAAPFVTGVAALIKTIRPDLTATQIKALILDNVDPVSALSDKCITGGRLNAYKALLAASESQTFTGDVNGDGRSDIIISRHNNSKRALTVYLGKTTGGFEEPITTQSTRNFMYHHIAFVGDFNGDGKTDVLIHWANDDNYRQLLVYISKGDGTFYEGANLSSVRLQMPNAYPGKEFVADVNGDGKDDFVVHWRTNDGTRATLVYKGTAASPYLIDTVSTAIISTDPYRFDEEVFMGDFNGDGYDDVLVHGVTDTDKRKLLIYKGRADAKFDAAVTLISTRSHYPEHYPTQFFVTDVNGDGKDDFVVHWRNTSGNRSNLVYFGTSASPYLLDAPTNALTSTNTYVYSDPVFVGDFNGDGRSDMLVHWADGSPKKRQLLYYLTNANGTYHSGVNQQTTNSHDPSAYGGSFYVADVNGDGRDDFIVKWRNGTKVEFLTYLGQSAGGFSSAVRTSPTTYIPYFNGD